MKNSLFLSVIFLLSSSMLCAQAPSQPLPIRLSYFSYALFQPGVKVGTEWRFKQWEKDLKGRKGTYTKHQSLFISPQIAFYAYPNNHRNILINAELGYEKDNSHRRGFSTWSIGLGYLHRSRIKTFSVNLGDGESGGDNREQISYLLPSLNYTFGRSINHRLDWFSQWSYAHQIALGKGTSAGLLFVELGLRFQLKASTSKNIQHD